MKLLILLTLCASASAGAVVHKDAVTMMSTLEFCSAYAEKETPQRAEFFKEYYRKFKAVLTVNGKLNDETNEATRNKVNEIANSYSSFQGMICDNMYNNLKKNL